MLRASEFNAAVRLKSSVEKMRSDKWMASIRDRQLGRHAPTVRRGSKDQRTDSRESRKRRQKQNEL